ncbi:MAG: hypothetical protein F4X63_05930 [Nitrospira sp. SB0662_bin_26]|nr:hypothetical protein [Nitrospira sp. SB0662_bin_26]
MTLQLILSTFSVRTALVTAISFFFSCVLSWANEPPPLTDDEFSRATNAGAQLAARLVNPPEGNIYGERLEAIDCGRILVTEGDSWLDYPLYADIRSELGKRNWAVFSSATYGDTLAAMLYNRSQLNSIYSDFIDIASLNHNLIDRKGRENYLRKKNIDFSALKPSGVEFGAHDPVETIAEMKQRCSKLYDRQGDLPAREIDRLPKGVFLSAGGNDLIFDALNLVLEYRASSASQVVDVAILDGFLHRVQRMLSEYVSAVEALCNEVFPGLGDAWGPCMNIPILIHGYDYALVSGKGYRIMGIEFTGPWLEPAFAKKGHQNRQENEREMRVVINRYNDALCHVATKFAESRSRVPFYFLDFRGEVNNDWNDEIHPNRAAFGILAKKIGRIISDFHGLSREMFVQKYEDAGLPCIKTQTVGS